MLCILLLCMYVMFGDFDKMVSLFLEVEGDEIILMVFWNLKG